MKNELVEKLNSCGVSKSEIERQLGMPKNSLSGMLKGSKEIPKKWEDKLQAFLDCKLEPTKKEDTETPFVSTMPLISTEQKPIENPLANIKGAFLGSELTKTATKCVFQLLLIEFNKYAMNDVPAKDCKKELLALKEKANHPDLNYRQKEAILERVDHYLNGTYGTPFNQNNAYKNH